MAMASRARLVTTVLFDLGGVACRFRPERRLAALTADCGLPPEEVRARVWDSGFDAECDLGRHNAAVIHARVRDMLGLRMDYERFRAAWALAFEPDGEVLEVVDEVRRHVRAALLTDNGPVLRDAMPILFPEITERLEPLLFSCGLGALKPDAVLFAAALVRLGEPAEQVLLVDDSPRVVEGARAFGLAALRFTTADALCRDLAQYVHPRAIGAGGSLAGNDCSDISS